MFCIVPRSEAVWQPQHNTGPSLSTQLHWKQPAEPCPWFKRRKEVYFEHSFRVYKGKVLRCSPHAVAGMLDVLCIKAAVHLCWSCFDFGEYWEHELPRSLRYHHFMTAAGRICKVFIWSNNPESAQSIAGPWGLKCLCVPRVQLTFHLCIASGITKELVLVQYFLGNPTLWCS